MSRIVRTLLVLMLCMVAFTNAHAQEPVTPPASAAPGTAADSLHGGAWPVILEQSESNVLDAQRHGRLVTTTLIVGGVLLTVPGGYVLDVAGPALGLSSIALAGILGPASGWMRADQPRRAAGSVMLHTAVQTLPPLLFYHDQRTDTFIGLALGAMVVNDIWAYAEIGSMGDKLRAAGAAAAIVPTVSPSGAPAVALAVSWR